MEQQREHSDSEELIEDMLFYHLSRAYNQMRHQFHETVQSNGLTVADWRVSANLFGQSTFSITEMASRTFLDPNSLQDIVSNMAEQGLCAVSDNQGALTTTGTEKGHER